MWRTTWRRFRRSKLAVAALVYVALITIVAAAAPLIAGRGRAVPFGPDDVDIASRLRPSSVQHRLGTDDLGRDVLARMIHGARVSLTVGFLATAISLVIGSLLGALAGYYGGPADWLVSRLIEVVLCFPFL